MPKTYEREFHPSLVQDLEEKNTVKLDIRRFPWEVIGEIIYVDADIFTIMTSTGSPTFNISDIIYYRHA